MTKRIKRIAALIIARILLVCVSFASLAEGTEEIVENIETEAAGEGSFADAQDDIAEESVQEESIVEEEADEDTNTEETAEEDTEAARNEETAEQTEEIAEDTDEEESFDFAHDDTTDTRDDVEDAQDDTADAQNDTVDVQDDTEDAQDDEDELDGYVYDEEEEYEELSDDAGYIDPEVVKQYVPEVTEDLIAESDRFVAEEENGNTEETVTVTRAWITVKTGEAVIGNTMTLSANADPELNGDIRWEIRDEQWEENVWQKIGSGEQVNIEILAENADDMIRFVMADGTVSEIFEINAEEGSVDYAQEDTDEEADGETEEAEAGLTEEEQTEEASGTEETEETAEERSFDSAQDDIEDAQDDTADAQDDGEGSLDYARDDTTDAEETEAATIRAWATMSEEDGAVKLNANADPELTGVCTWQTLTEEGKWQRIGYGDSVVVEGEGTYRFVMQDGTVSEEYVTGGAQDERSFDFAQDDNVDAQDDTADAQDDSDEEAEERSLDYARDDTVDGQDDSDEEAVEEITAETTEETVEEQTEVQEETEEETAEEAEEAVVPELPEDRKVSIASTWDDEEPGFGSTAHFTAELEKYEGLQYTLQWMKSTDDVNWEAIEGETGETMDLVITEDNYLCYWRVEVHVTGIYTD